MMLKIREQCALRKLNCFLRELKNSLYIMLLKTATLDTEHCFKVGCVSVELIYSLYQMICYKEVQKNKYFSNLIV